MPLIDLIDRLDKHQRDFLDHNVPTGLEGLPLNEWPEEVFLNTLCDAIGLPTYQITADNVDLGSYERLESLCDQHRFLPLFEEGVLMYVACLEPWNSLYIAHLRKLTRKEIRPAGITERELDEALATLSTRLTRTKAQAKPLVSSTLRVPLTHWRFDPDDRNGPLKTVEAMINQAHVEGASDIHVEPFEDELAVRFRINNDTHPMPPIEGGLRDLIVDAFKIKANIPVSETNQIRRGRISEVTSVGRLDLRVECLPVQHGQKVVCRLLDPRSLTRFYGKLPFREKHLEMVKRCIETYKGLFLVTGPTGSGKSTTLLGIITSLDIHGLNISTIEDPIEYSIKYLNQTDVSRGVGAAEGKVTFSTALKSLLRQDPDVILVGEIRDLETMKIAIEGSQTGHLIFSTLHTNNCIETIKRALDLQIGNDRIDPGSLASALSCIVAQRLVEELCEHCRISVPTPPSARRCFEAYGMNAPIAINSRQGCNRCRNGISGRLPVFEVMEITDDLRTLIANNFSESKFEKAWRESGGVTLAEYGLHLVAEGRVDFREIRSLIWNQNA